MSDRDCQHGQLTRVCDRCADASEIEQLRAELRRLHALCEEMGEALERIASLDYANAAINCCALTAVEISQAALTKWKESK